MRKRSSLFSSVALLLLCFLGIAGAAAAAYYAQPAFSDAIYRIDGGQERTDRLPLLVDTDKKVMIDLRFMMNLNILHASTFILTADDCAVNVTVNEAKLPGDFSDTCYWNAGKRLNLAPYLQAGVNEVRIRVDDNGGKGGASLRVSWTDPVLVFLMMCMATLFACALLLLLGLLHVPRGPRALTVLLVTALLLRLGLAFHPGHGSDLGLNKHWARTAATQGPAALYDMTDGSRDTDYPPLSMLVFASSGWIYTQFSPDHNDYHVLEHLLIKLPAILADLGIIILLWMLMRRLRGDKAGLIAGAIYAFHPAAMYDTAVWGQTDSIFTLAMLGSLVAAVRGRWWLCGACAAAAFLLKAQALVLFPTLLVIVFIARKHIIHIAAGGVVTTAAVLLPYAWKGTVPGVVDVYLNSLGAYKNLSVGAFNMWRALYGDKVSMEDTRLFFGLLPMRSVGLLLFAAATAAALCVLWQPMKRAFAKHAPRDLFAPFLAVALTNAAFFTLNTEMHERYLFPFTVFAIPLCFLGRRGITLYASMSFLFLLNLMIVLHFGHFDGRIWDEFPGLPVSIGALQTVLLIATICYAGWSYRPFFTAKGRGGRPAIRHWLRAYGLYPAASASAAVRK